MAFAAVPLAWWVLFRTRFGLRLRAVGETRRRSTPQASPWCACVTPPSSSAACWRDRGTHLAVAQTAQFIPNMSAGKGFMALAALVFGKWRPWNAMAACLLFGFLDAVAIRLQGVSIGDFPIPVQAIEALPYILTVFLLAGFIPARRGGPKASAPRQGRNSPALHAMQRPDCGQPMLSSRSRIYLTGKRVFDIFTAGRVCDGLGVFEEHDAYQPAAPGPPLALGCR